MVIFYDGWCPFCTQQAKRLKNSTGSALLTPYRSANPTSAVRTALILNARRGGFRRSSAGRASVWKVSLWSSASPAGFRSIGRFCRRCWRFEPLVSATSCTTGSQPGERSSSRHAPGKHAYRILGIYNKAKRWKNENRIDPLRKR